MVELLADEEVRFDDFRLCLHHPEGTVPELSGPCDCRKPAPGMLLAAAGDLDVDLGASWMIGDTDGDVAGGPRGGLPDDPRGASRQRAQADGATSARRRR